MDWVREGVFSSAWVREGVFSLAWVREGVFGLGWVRKGVFSLDWVREGEFGLGWVHYVLTLAKSEGGSVIIVVSVKVMLVRPMLAIVLQRLCVISRSR